MQYWSDARRSSWPNGSIWTTSVRARWPRSVPLGSDAVTEVGVADIERSIEICLATNDVEAGRVTNNLAYWYLLAGDVERARTARRTRAAGWPRASATSGCSAGSADSSRNTTTTAAGGTTRCASADAFIADSEGGSPHYLESTDAVDACARSAGSRGKRARRLRMRFGRRSSGERRAIRNSFCRRSQSGLRVELELGTAGASHRSLATELLGQRAEIADPASGGRAGVGGGTTRDRGCSAEKWIEGSRHPVGVERRRACGPRGRARTRRGAVRRHRLAARRGARTPADGRPGERPPSTRRSTAR